jgi:hypothetical protein
MTRMLLQAGACNMGFVCLSTGYEGHADALAVHITHCVCATLTPVQVLRAVADGYDVRGLYYWTLVDSYEWADGFAAKFGLYEWNQNGENDRWE